MSKNSNILFGMALGVAAGAIAAYLLSSDETKEKIKSNARKVTDILMDEIDKVTQKAADVNQEADSSVNGKG